MQPRCSIKSADHSNSSLLVIPGSQERQLLQFSPPDLIICSCTNRAKCGQDACSWCSQDGAGKVQVIATHPKTLFVISEYLLQSGLPDLLTETDAAEKTAADADRNKASHRNLYLWSLIAASEPFAFFKPADLIIGICNSARCKR